MVAKKRSAAPRSSFSHPQFISRLMAKPNIWADWLLDDEISPVSWSRLSALLVRRLPPARVAQIIGPALVEIREQAEHEILQCAEGEGSSTPPRVDRYAYMEAFTDLAATKLPAVISHLDGDEDVRWFAYHLRDDRASVTNLLWFFLGGIAFATINLDLQPSMLPPSDRWLAEIDWPFPGDYSAYDYLIDLYFDDFEARHPKFVWARRSSEQSKFCDQDPFEDTSVALFEAMWARQRREARLVAAPTVSALVKSAATSRQPVDGPGHNLWDRALDCVGVPKVDWRRYAAVCLSEVPIDTLSARVTSVISDISQVTSRAVLSGLEQGRFRAHPQFPFKVWFAHWQHQFTHWTDPVRSELESLCVTDSSRWFALQMADLNGLAFADFLFGVASGHELAGDLIDSAEVQTSTHRRLFGPSWLDRHGCEPPLIQATLTAYDDFRRSAPFECEDAPESIHFQADFDRPLAGRGGW